MGTKERDAGGWKSLRRNAYPQIEVWGRFRSLMAGPELEGTMRAFRAMSWLALCAAAGVLAGCETPELQKAMLPASDRQSPDEERTHRTRYQTEHDSDSIRWLLSRRVRQGMSEPDVAAILGEPGTPVPADQWIKNEGGYHMGDETYKWGPDDAGRAYYLVFREGKLVNYNPSEFATGL